MIANLIKSGEMLLFTFPLCDLFVLFHIFIDLSSFLIENVERQRDTERKLAGACGTLLPT